jgi:hypothetical protein
MCSVMALSVLVSFPLAMAVCFAWYQSLNSGHSASRLVERCLSVLESYF